MIRYWPNASGEMAQRIRAHDWAATPLGPIETWPQALMTTVGILLVLREPAALAWGPEYIILYNDAYIDFYGDRSHPPALGVGVPVARAEIWSAIGPDYEQVLRGGQSVRHEDRLVPVLRHGRMEDIRWTYSFDPVADAAAPNGVGGVLILATKRTQTTQAMQGSDGRQLFLSKLSDTLRPLADPDAIRLETCRLLGEQLNADWVVYGMIDLARDIVDIDRGYTTNGQPPATGEQPLSAFAWTLPSYQAGITVVVADTQTSEKVPAAERPAMAAIKMASIISVPLLKNGELVGALAISQETPRTWTPAEVRLAEETAERIWEAIERARSEAALLERESRLQVLVHELQHRTRNLMGVVRATASKTLKTSIDLADFGSRFQSRIDALARVQGLLSKLVENDRVTFDEIIGSELAAMGARDDRVTLDGPANVRLRSSAVQMLAMAVHELATNALKYGALGQPSAHLLVRWRLEEDRENGMPWLRVHWIETGVSMPDRASVSPERGQGSELIERALPYQLKARTSFELGGDGVRCTIELPVSASNRMTLSDA
jgi:two-component sensor histidine kinase